MTALAMTLLPAIFSVRVTRSSTKMIMVIGRLTTIQTPLEPKLQMPLQRLMPWLVALLRPPAPGSKDTNKVQTNSPSGPGTTMMQSVLRSQMSMVLSLVSLLRKRL